MLLEHAEGLFAVMRDDEDMWRYLPHHIPRSVCDTVAWMTPRLALRERGLSLPFTVFALDDTAIAGTTSYSLISETNRSLEIGGTAYGREHRRTAVNTECKYLMLSHAFETLGCIRVTFHTDARNERSQRAIERIGGVREGVMRRDRIVKDGYARSSVLYSILDDEWPAVKARLEEMLRR
jgi:RimJ/RimL family protein N-acetyltransferase